MEVKEVYSELKDSIVLFFRCWYRSLEGRWWGWSYSKRVKIENLNFLFFSFVMNGKGYFNYYWFWSLVKGIWLFFEIFVDILA